MSENNTLVPVDYIEHSIIILRGQRVMLDSDFAGLYEVETKNLNKAVKRNILRFPRDFMFQLTEEEVKDLRFQIGTSKITGVQEGKGGRRYLPYAFTEYGVAMLSSVLKSERAIVVNIEIMRTFGKYRSMAVQHKDLAAKIKDMEKKYDKSFLVIFKALEKLLEDPPEPKKQPIGFNTK
jgi:hypothetical protein